MVNFLWEDRVSGIPLTITILMLNVALSCFRFSLHVAEWINLKLRTTTNINISNQRVCQYNIVSITDWAKINLTGTWFGINLLHVCCGSETSDFKMYPNVNNNWIRILARLGQEPNLDPDQGLRHPQHWSLQKLILNKQSIKNVHIHIFFSS